MASLFSIRPKNTVMTENELNEDERKKDAAQKAIQMEKDANKLQSERRNIVFENIIYEDSPSYKSPKYIVYGVLGIIPALSLKWFYTLIPVHNLILKPQYWYELPIQLTFGFLPIMSAYSMYSCSYFMNIKYIKSARHAISIWIVMVVMTFLLFGILYLSWVHLLHYQFPVPLTGYMYLLCSIITVLLALWYRFPREWRNNDRFVKRLRYFMIVFFLGQLVYLEYAILTKLLLTLPKDYQWILALFLPFIRELNSWAQIKMFTKFCSDGDPSSVRIICSHGIGTSHSFFLAYTVGSIATVALSAVIIGTDFLINMSI